MTTPSIQTADGWKLITAGTEQISVDPNGILHFPRHCSPQQVPDLIEAMTKAAEIGAAIREQLTREPAQKAAGLPTNIITEGPPPPGAIRLPQQNRATIGRTKTRRQP